MSTTVETVGRVTPRRRRVPSRIWYGVALAMLLLGTGLGVGWGVASTVRAHDEARGLPRTGLPGAVQVRVVDGTSRLVYFEGEADPGIDSLGLQVTGPDGSPVPVKVISSRW